MHSQNDEERHILAHTPAMGRFLDIGAFHPTALSNTRALYERGWDGVVVEPSPGPARGLVAEYGAGDRVSVVCAAIGAERSVIPMWITDDAVTTADGEIYEKWRQSGGYLGRAWVPTITLADLLNQFGSFQFVNIDTEGSSVDILHWLLACPMNPACICVEHDNRIMEITNLFQVAGYRQAHLNAENLIIYR